MCCWRWIELAKLGRVQEQLRVALAGDWPARCKSEGAKGREVWNWTTRAYAVLNLSE